MPVEIRKPAPEFTATALVDGTFETISLSQYKGKYVVLFFYPLDFTFVCPTEIIAFDKKKAEFDAANTVLLACSTDSEYSHLAWTNTPRSEGGVGPLSIPLIADPSHKISKSYGVHIEEEGISFRGLFIIDPEQNVRIMQINDLPVGRSVDETLRLLEALQFTDKHGEVCPANWQKGEEGLKTTQDGIKEYLTKTN
ncbi:thiol peroxiredoxin [Conidiobolus coronatus NRRL 28638]|uniref:thioredoxin-dependent peroxiredoxin n=1 Tax=Conidiobolus coronatus (strain ATCC 28846 / CBS 209.66 / NRRL 28638) TaxID=796925 RepID=A0A137P723_CONC2|nr:thiol peroxiredoxin [Conidiobolus coronatus NRRL 28638]|eukprot:KXN70721.1 thiol peroxiredoxin [Conidiobolus coronatus NRRL 28638]